MTLVAFLPLPPSTCHFVAFEPPDYPGDLICGSRCGPSTSMGVQVTLHRTAAAMLTPPRHVHRFRLSLCLASPSLIFSLTWLLLYLEFLGFSPCGQLSPTACVSTSEFRCLRKGLANRYVVAIRWYRSFLAFRL